MSRTQRLHSLQTDGSNPPDAEAGQRSGWLGSALCLAVALYFLGTVGYALARYDLFASATPQLIRYVLVPGALALGLILACFLLSAERRLTVGRYAFAVLAALLLFEAYLTSTTIGQHFANLGWLSPAQSRDLERGERLVRGFTLRELNIVHQVDTLSKAQLSGFPGTRVLLCSPEGTTVSYLADRYGFNNPDAVYDEPLEVVILGDSFVEGFCLPPGQDLVGQVRSAGLNAAGVGIRGNGPLLELAALGRYGAELNPRHVILAFFEGNDWKNLGFEREEPWLQEALIPGADFGDPSSPEPAVRAHMLGWLEKRGENEISGWDIFQRTSLARNYMALHQTTLSLGLLYPKVPGDLPIFPQVLERGRALSEAFGAEFSLLYIPQISRFAGALPNGFVFDQMRDKVVGAARANGVRVIDLVPHFEAVPNPLTLYAADAHFSPSGATLAGRVLVGSLSSRDQISDAGEALR